MIKAQKEDFAYLAALVARSFEDYPLYNYFFANKVAQRAYYLVMYEFLSHPESVYTNEDKSVAVLFVKEGDKKAKPDGAFVSKLIRHAGARGLARSVRFLITSKKAAKKAQQSGNKLIFLAVEKEKRGHGIATAILDEIRREYDFYLDTHKHENVTFYKNRGAELVSAVTLTEKVTHYVMHFSKK